MGAANAEREADTLLTGLQTLEAAARQAGCREPLSAMAREFRDDQEAMGRGAWPLEAVALGVETIAKADRWRFGAHD